MDLRKVFDRMISVSELGRGQASKVIQSVEDQGNPYIVVKNNKPQAVIISINEYTELMQAKDFLDSMQLTSNAFNHQNQPPGFSQDSYPSSSLSPAKGGVLTEDEINIFLEPEESD